jgi:hypothetical protein
MKRLCFLSPDISHARAVVQTLGNKGIPDQDVSVLARSDIDLDGLIRRLHPDVEVEGFEPPAPLIPR